MTLSDRFVSSFSASEIEDLGWSGFIEKSGTLLTDQRKRLGSVMNLVEVHQACPTSLLRLEGIEPGSASGPMN